MSWDNQFIGRGGENWFSHLCSRAKVSCNLSQEDDYGWDALIEFRPKKPAHIPADMGPTAKAAKVQIKTTTSESLSVGISLQNLLNYTKTPLPVFVTLVVMEEVEVGEEEPRPRCYARHVWRDEVAAWLERIRDAETKGESLNDTRLTVKFGEADEHSRDLLSWISAQIDAVPSPYETTKAGMVAATGFEDSVGTAATTFTLEGPNDFLDLQLGLIPSIKIDRFTYHSERFGIPSPLPEVDVFEGEMSIIPEGKKGWMRLHFPEGRQISLPAEMYRASEPGPTKLRTAYRVKSRSVDLVMGPGNRTIFNAELDMEEALPIRELAAFANLRAVKAGEKVQVSVDFDGREVEVSGFLSNGNLDTQFWGWARLWTEALMAIGVTCDREIPDLTMSGLSEARNPLQALGALASNSYLRMEFTADYDGCAGMLAWGAATVNGHSFGALVRRDVTHEARVDDRQQVGFGPPRIMRALMGRDEEWIRDTLHEAYWKSLRGHNGEHELMAVGDIAFWIIPGMKDVPIDKISADPIGPIHRRHNRKVSR